MRIRTRHWIVAAVLSLAGHLAVVALAANRTPEVQIERSAGAPGAIWGMPVQSIAETVDAVEPVTDDAVEAVEPVDTAETESPEEAVEETPEAAEQPTEEMAAAEAASAQAAETEAAQQAGEPVLPAVSEEEARAVEEVRTAALPEASTAEAVTGTDVTAPLPPVRPANVPRITEPPEPKQQATSEPTREARRQPAAAAPAGQQAGDSGRRSTQGGQAALSSYSGRIIAHLQRYKRYPREAARERLGGTATLTFTIAANGAVSGARLSRGTGYQPLDAEALAMVSRASPFPPIPSSIGRPSMTFTVPVRFTPR